MDEEEARPMGEDELDEACDALINWFKSQRISPLNGTQVMARAMIVACASFTVDKCDGPDLPTLKEEVRRAAKLLPQTLTRMMGNRR